MLRSILTGGAALAFGLGLAAPAASTTVIDPTGDFLPSYVGPHNPDLDVTRFTVNFDQGTSTFFLNAKLAGTINPASVGLYVIGVDTGLGAIRPFGSIGNPNVIFDQVVIVQKDGTGQVTGAAGGPLATGAITIAGDEFSVTVPLAMLPSTGISPLTYGFNLWPRTALTNNNEISDFAPDNALVRVTGVPEPSTWLLLAAGFGAAGIAIRRRGRGYPTGAAPCTV